MSSPSIDKASENQSIDWKWLALPAFLYILLIALTEPPFIGDTPFYAGQLAAAPGLSSPVLWEFGHILWRPIGFILSPLFQAAIPDHIAWTHELKISYGLICLTVLSGLISTVLIYDLSRRILRHPLWAMLPVFVLVCGDAFLSYSHSGMPYIPAVAALTGGLWLQLVPKADQRGGQVTLLWSSACLFGIACLLWFPFVFVLPAAVCARKFVPLRNGGRWEWTQAFAVLVIAGGVVTAGVVTAAFMAGVHSISGFRLWMSAASHEWHQNRQWLRAVSGCPRLLIDLARDGINLKRFTFKDPYNPVSAAVIVRLMLWKIGLFYAFLAAVAVLAWTSARTRPVLILAAFAGLPLLAFAVLLFEPSSPERFLPVLPFLLLAVAAAWAVAPTPGMKTKWLRGVIVVFVLALPVMNWPGFAGSFSPESRQAHARLDDLRKSAQPDDVLVTINLQDPVIQLIDQSLFDSANRPAPFRNHWLITIAAEHAHLWRQQFAAFVLQNWRENRNVWVTKGAVADRPDPDARWVEGDNPAVHWKDIATFFRSIQFDQQTARPDGFLRMRRSSELEDRLARLSGEAAGQTGY